MPAVCAGVSRSWFWFGSWPLPVMILPFMSASETCATSQEKKCKSKKKKKKEMHIKTTMRYHLKGVRIAINKKSTQNTVGRHVIWDRILNT